MTTYFQKTITSLSIETENVLPLVYVRIWKTQHITAGFYERVKLLFFVVILISIFQKEKTNVYALRTLQMKHFPVAMS